LLAAGRDAENYNKYDTTSLRGDIKDRFTKNASGCHKLAFECFEVF